VSFIFLVESLYVCGQVDVNIVYKCVTGYGGSQIRIPGKFLHGGTRDCGVIRRRSVEAAREIVQKKDGIVATVGYKQKLLAHIDGSTTLFEKKN
jgi:hypothetical protein